MLNSSLTNIGNFTFDRSRLLGKGTTGNVYQGFRNNDRKKVAIKIINLYQNQNEVTKSLLESQKNALRTLNTNANVIKLIQIIQNQQFCFIITEIYYGGTLKDHINKISLPQQEVFAIFSKILNGYCAISDSCIIHRDLKPSNIMLSSKQPIIIDFGFCEIIKTKTVMRAFNVGSPSYMSPEAFRKSMFSQKSDVWSLGIIFYQMLTGKTLDEGIQTQTYFQSLSQVLRNKINEFDGVHRQILQGILRINPLERISCHKIKYILDKHRIQKINKKQLIVSNKTTNQMTNSNIYNLKRQTITFQSLRMNPYSISTIQNERNILQNLNVRSKLAQSRYRPKFMSPHPQNQDIKKQKQLKLNNNQNILMKSLDKGYQQQLMIKSVDLTKQNLQKQNIWLERFQMKNKHFGNYISPNHRNRQQQTNIFLQKTLFQNQNKKNVYLKQKQNNTLNINSYKRSEESVKAQLFQNFNENQELKRSKEKFSFKNSLPNPIQTKVSNSLNIRQIQSKNTQNQLCQKKWRPFQQKQNNRPCPNQFSYFQAKSSQFQQHQKQLINQNKISQNQFNYLELKRQNIFSPTSSCTRQILDNSQNCYYPINNQNNFSFKFIQSISTPTTHIRLR